MAPGDTPIPGSYAKQAAMKCDPAQCKAGNCDPAKCQGACDTEKCQGNCQGASTGKRCGPADCSRNPVAKK